MRLRAQRFGEEISTARVGPGARKVFQRQTAFRASLFDEVQLRKEISKRIRLVRVRKSYTMKELARFLGVNKRTIQYWRREGLAPIDPDDKPLLFMGDEIRRFLGDRVKKRKCPLEIDQFFCPRCRGARRSNPADVRITDTNRRIGKGDSSLIVSGICRVCGCRVNRFSTRKRLNPAWSRMVGTRAHRSRYGHRSPIVNSMISGGN